MHRTLWDLFRATLGFVYGLWKEKIEQSRAGWKFHLLRRIGLSQGLQLRAGVQNETLGDVNVFHSVRFCFRLSRDCKYVGLGGEVLEVSIAAPATCRMVLAPGSKGCSSGCSRVLV